jgi:dTDP-4-dehydrorhamnose 3,5-epimerase
MKFTETQLLGCYVIHSDVFTDHRGRFVKILQEPPFAERGLRTDFREVYYSVSKQRVLRGLHFQTPPHEHAKLVYCPLGRVLDVLVDIRAGSPTYRQHATFALSAQQGSSLYIPPGLAHGFYTVSDEALMVYHVTSAYAPAHDTGILWNSAGIAWPDAQPILSERDSRFPTLAGFQSPFRY